MKFDVSDISFFKIKMLQFHTFPATYRKRLQREGAINHFYGNIIFCYLNSRCSRNSCLDGLLSSCFYQHPNIGTRSKL